MSLTTSIFDLDAYPCFNNMHTRVQGLGLAFDPESNDIYYLSAAGPQAAVKSIYSSLCRRASPRAKQQGGNNSQIFVTHWASNALYGIEQGRFKSVYTNIPDSNYKHLLARSTKQTLILCTDPAALLENAAPNALLTPHKQRIIDQFVGYLNTATQVPVLPRWGPTLWGHAMQNGHITKLQTRGDCIGGWLISTATNWTEVVQNLLQENVISILEIQQGKPIHETRIINKNGLLPNPTTNAKTLMLPAPISQ